MRFRWWILIILIIIGVLLLLGYVRADISYENINQSVSSFNLSNSTNTRICQYKNFPDLNITELGFYMYKSNQTFGEHWEKDQTQQNAYYQLYSGATTRACQKMNIPNQRVYNITYDCTYAGSPDGSIYWRVRKSSDDSVIQTVTTDVTECDGTDSNVSYTSPSLINEDVYVCAEYSSGGPSDHLRIYLQTSDVKASENFYIYNDSGYFSFTSYDLYYFDLTLSNYTEIAPSGAINFTTRNTLGELNNTVVYADSSTLPFSTQAVAMNKSFASVVTFDGYGYVCAEYNGTGYVHIFEGSSKSGEQLYTYDGSFTGRSGDLAYWVNGTNATGPTLAVTISSPISTTYTSSSISFISVTSLQSYCNFTLDQGVTNFTMSTTDNFTHSNTTNVADGEHTVYYYCTSNNSRVNNSEYVSFTVDEATAGTGGGGGGPPVRDVLRSDDPFFYWNPQVYLLLREQIKVTFAQENYGELPDNLFTLFSMFVSYIMRSPSSLVPHGGIAQDA